MKFRCVIFVITGIIVIALAGCAKPPPPDVNAIRSICLAVEQKHAQVGGDFSLPVEPVLREELTAMGLEVRDPGQICDAKFTVSLEFEIFDTLIQEQTCFYGSEAKGEASLEVQGFQTIIEPLIGKTGETILEYCYKKTSHQIYAHTVPEVVVDAMVNIFGKPAVTALVEGGRYEKTFATMLRQGVISEEEVAPVLLLLLDNTDEVVQRNAMDILREGTLGETGEDIISIMRKSDGIVDLLLSLTEAGKHPDLREGAISFLGELALEPNRVVPVLISLLDEEDEDLRVYAMIALKRYGPEATEAIPALEAMLQDKSSRIRSIAKEALDSIR